MENSMDNTYINCSTKELREAIAHIQQLLEKLEKPKPKQWEPCDGEFTIHGDGGVFLTGPHNRSPSYISAGMVRKTKAAADKASATMRTQNRLLVYVYEFGGDWEADWINECQRKFTVLRSHETEQWEKTSCGSQETLGTVYMSKECAEGLIAKLESGEVVL
jgi:hypothetical protein